MYHTQSCDVTYTGARARAMCDAIHRPAPKPGKSRSYPAPYLGRSSVAMIFPGSAYPRP